MNKALQSLALLLLIASGNSYAVQTICDDNSTAGWPIPFNNTTIIPINFNFGDNGQAVDVDVSVNLSHPYVGDISATMANPVATSVRLFERPNTALAPFVLGPPYGCTGDNIVASFDDASLNGTLEASTCGNLPAYGGDFIPHDTAPNDLSAMNGEEVNGTWNFTFTNSESFDIGTFNEVCLTVQFASVTFDQWISTNATCSDTLDSTTVITGTNLFTCYTVTNAGDEAFSLAAVDIVNNLGHDLSGLVGTYANTGATQSRTVVIGPTTAGPGTYPQGTTNGTSSIIVRGASVDFPATQNIATNEAITVIVTLAGEGNKPLYLYNNTAPALPLPAPGAANYLSRVIPTTDQGRIDMNANTARVWTQTPAAQAVINLDNTKNIPVQLYIQRRGGNDGTQRRIDINISHSGGGGTVIGTLVNAGFNTAGNGINLEEFFVPITGATSIPVGETLILTLTNPQNQNNRRYRLYVDGTSAQLSQVILPSLSIIDVSSVTVHAENFVTNPASPVLSDYPRGATVFIRATVTDPFGSFDITSANITITDPTPAILVNGVDMGTAVNDDGVATKIFEYSYLIPAFSLEGTWSFSVTALEGAEGTITDIGSTNFIVASPSLTVVKSTIGGISTINPGGTITYQIIVTNSGSGRATTVTLNDTPSPFVDTDQLSFSCASGCPASGVSLGTVNFTLGGDGDVTAWDVIMSGDMLGSSAFTLQYQGTVE